MLKIIGKFKRKTAREMCFIILEYLKVTKDLFNLNLTLGQEVVVPKILDSSKLPSSFNFYSPLLSFVKHEMKDGPKQILNSKRKANASKIID
jgi:hypothetical protein